MASSHILGGLDNGSKPRRTGSIVARSQKYPPPAALPEYVNRALPPRPDSNTSSAYDSLDEATKRAPIPKPPLPISHFRHDSPNPSPAGILNEAGLAMVHPQSITSAPQQLQPQKKSLEIAAPQPIYPAPIILDTRNQDFNIVSPVSAGNTTAIAPPQPYEVSPLSPTSSQHSFGFAADLKRISSPTTGDLAVSLTPSDTESNAGHHIDNNNDINLNTNANTNTNINAKNRNFVYTGTHTAHSSDDLAAARLASPHSQVLQIDGRYSDPGSPISGAVIHPPTWFPSPSDPDPGAPRLVDMRDPPPPAFTLFPPPPQTQPQIQAQTHNFVNRLPPRPKSPSPALREEDSPLSGGVSVSVSGGNLAKTTSAETSGSGKSGTTRIAFAGPGGGGGGGGSPGTINEGFKRARANSKRSAPPPPPLKLSERPIADAYVKTPFPPAPAPALQRGLSNPTQRTRKVSEDRGRDKDKEGFVGFGGGAGGAAGVEGVMRRLNRVSSLPGFGFARGLRRNSVLGVGGGGAGSGGGGGGGEGVLGLQRGDREKERDKEKQKEREREREQQKRKQSEDVRKLEKEGSASPMPKVKSFLERARQLSMGHGLGIGMGSEEARKERRRAEIKRQIRFGEPRT
ncbi:uncharacterized protein F4807DRAFT_469678 [Annulohypoxylon truncatum]|uniref:uncharacterized protein n=1 Tax=Annulohypoxylon truncatum TaxID=327061 RepID=UPI002007CB30|nr:uncharacterized protein F4807DRAFT_469678 [Annulohypoxylon truncatum]KAI1213922.1 hypothetical protein F4807DRAFT_469678 [Annulohypoxylon truncatum]